MHSVKDIYLIRHGETAYNRLGMVQGSGIDSDLNALGQQQAQSFFEYYKDLNFDKIYTSKLRERISLFKVLSIMASPGNSTKD